MADPVTTGLILNGWKAVFITGCVGGIFFEAAKWYKLRDGVTFATYKSAPIYWLITVVMILCGGAWAVFNGIKDVNAIMALVLGASAPLSFAGLGTAAYKPPGKPDERGSMHKFLIWR